MRRTFFRENSHLRVLSLLVFSLLVVTSELFAEITINSVSYASKTDLDEDTPIIYGALSGPNCSSDTELCNSCESVGLSGSDPDDACSEAKVNLSGSLQICFQHTESENSNLIISDSTTVSTESLSLTETATDVPPNTSDCISLSWDTICATATTDDDCATKLDKTLYLVADEDQSNTVTDGDETKAINIKAQDVATAIVENSIATSSGNCDASGSTIPCIYSFDLLNGDEKFYINAIDGNSIPTGSSDNLTFEAVRFYFSTAGLSDARPGGSETSGGYSDITVDSDGNLDSFFVSGLTNGSTYNVRTALVDEAGNVGFALSAASITGLSTNVTAMPEEVYGLLEEGKCFIATAAYGSLLDNKLSTLRIFRDDILLKTDIGSSFVDWYYKYSPKYAQSLAKQDSLRVWVRGLLWPLWLFAELSLITHPILAALMFLMAFAMVYKVFEGILKKVID